MIHYTIRPVLWEHKKDAQGKMPLKIAVTINRKVAYLKTNFKLSLSEWNGREITTDHPSHKKANQELRTRIVQVSDIIMDAERDEVNITAAQVKDIAEGDRRSTNFVKFVKDLTKDTNLKHSESSGKLHQKELNRVIAFAGAGLDINRIDPQWLRKYEAHERNRGLAQNTINTQFKWLRRMITTAYKERLIKHNPFEDYTIARYIPSIRVYLDQKELEKLKGLYKKNLNPAMEKTLTYLLLGCYTGFRHSDWMRFDPDKMVDGNVLRIRPKKTEKATGDWVVLPIGKSLRQVIVRLKEINEPPFALQTCNDILKGIAGMAEIDKEITTHTGRHSFGCLCASLGLPRSITAELMGVSEQTVDYYYHITGEATKHHSAALAKV